MGRTLPRLGRALLILLLSWGLRSGAVPGTTLALLGDVMLGRGIAAAAASPAQVMGVLAPNLARADLVLANLESPLILAPAETLPDDTLCAPSGQRQVLAAAGLDLLSLANNHHLDCGKPGLDDTRRLLAATGIQPIGPDLVVIYRQVNSLRLAFLALDDVSSPIPLAEATAAISQARASGAIVVVSMHWGAEYQGGPSTRQREIAEALTQAGAGLVWGHHPHVLQPAERLACPLPRGCLVLFSLGNAVFDQVGLIDTRRSAAILVRLDERGVIEVRAAPFSIDVRRGRLLTSSPDDASAVMARLGSEVRQAGVPSSP